MELSFKQKEYIIYLSIIAIIGVCVYLFIIDALTGWNLFFAILFCAIWVKYIRDKRTTIERLCKALHQFSFKIKDMYWDKEGKKLLNITGTYSDENFHLLAAPDSEYIRICYLPWGSIKASDPNINNIFETVNESNSQLGNCSIIITEPNKDGQRNIITESMTILPEDKPFQYLESLICDMINSRHIFAENMQNPRQWMQRQREPIIGFSANK